ncbi:MAG TPA: class I SAM-dependent methyltransferase [Streptosporangiaceae bacterium]|nr:class I SAM-dependent methyltransferase [Streptosporangiaceae bacterium]
MTSQAEALLSPEGAELLAEVARARAAGQPALATAVRLRRDHPAHLVAAATAQDELRVAGQAKFSRALDMLFTRPGLEQASSETAARHRAARLAAATDQTGRLADLGCGIGGDLIALAAGRAVLAVDRDPDHLLMAAHNAAVYDVAQSLHTQEADVRDVSLAGVTTVFADPARRSPRGAGPRRRLRPGDSEPPLDWCFALTGQVANVVIKAAPGLPAGTTPDGWETEFVADGRDLKEAVLWSPALATATTRATILPAGDTLTPEPGDPVPVKGPGSWLFDPSPAVTRSGLVEDLARRLGAWKIDDQIAFLSADTARATPFARTLKIIESAPWHEKHFARRLRELAIGAVDLRRRGLAGDVDQIHRRLRLSGPHRATVVLTRVADRPWGLICVEPGTELDPGAGTGADRDAAGI